MTQDRRDIHQQITDQIVAAIEAGVGEFKMPWHRSHGSLMRPTNIESGKRYQGINVVSLWMAAEQRGFSAPVWGTYRQWLAKGAQVRKGEKSSLIVFYKEREFERTNEVTGETEEARSLIARASHVFNVAQVDGFVMPAAEDAPAPATIDPIEQADTLLRLSGADIREGGERAFYSPGEDCIVVPDRWRFTGTEAMTPTEAYYTTKLHELGHWTGHKSRLARDFSGRFGSDAYAFEELIAGLGEAYLCADLGVTTAMRVDHAAYVGHWLKVMKGDKRAIFTAASQAQRAANFLLAFLEPAPPVRPDSTNDLLPDALRR